jgi:hypothetical protein
MSSDVTSISRTQGTSSRAYRDMSTYLGVVTRTGVEQALSVDARTVICVHVKAILRSHEIRVFRGYVRQEMERGRKRWGKGSASRLSVGWLPVGWMSE